MGSGGDARHVTVAAAAYRFTIIIHDNIDYRIGEGAKVWRLQYDRVREHYDAVVSRDDRGAPVCVAEKISDVDCSTATPQAEPTTSAECSIETPPSSSTAGPPSVRMSKLGRTGTGRGHLGSGRPHNVTTINVGGKSREALLNAMDRKSQVNLIQEHRIAGPGLIGVQATAMAKGWHGVWDIAETNGVGRSGGTAAPVKRPVQIFRGADIPRATVAVICWTRESRAHFISA